MKTIQNVPIFVFMGKVNDSFCVFDREISHQWVWNALMPLTATKSQTWTTDFIMNRTTWCLHELCIEYAIHISFESSLTNDALIRLLLHI